MSSLLSVQDLHKSFIEGGDEIHILKGVNLELAEGERLAVVGESGVGKSTLLHLLGTLDRPTTGRILYRGSEMPMDDQEALAQFRNREIGFVFQFHYLLPDFTALENVMLPSLIARESRGAARARATELLERVGLSHRLSHRPGELSGGEQQRVAVARALARRPRLLLADEPTGNLDPATGEGVQQLLLELNRECGSALVVATHSARLAAAMRRTLRLVDGQLIDTPASEMSLRGGAAGGAS
jgi:lipoprotein-releasing system ATP-binding protein